MLFHKDEVLISRSPSSGNGFQSLAAELFRFFRVLEKKADGGVELALILDAQGRTVFLEKSGLFGEIVDLGAV